VFEALLKGRRITHDGNRCHRWNVENVSIKSDDAGRIRPVKPKKASKRIDGVPAAIMGIGRLMVAPQAASYQIFFV
jgi:phage terminase large subunit-like protein